MWQRASSRVTARDRCAIRVNYPIAQGRLQGSIGAAESLSSIFGPILMTQVFGTFEHSLSGAPFFVAACLAVVALLIAVRVGPPPATAP